MKQVRLGAAGAHVSELALGTMNFGTVVDEPESFAILDAAVEAGITFVDTADVYGAPPMGEAPGITESLLGRWMTQRGTRDAIVLATKAYEPTGGGRNDRGLSAVHIRNAVDASLRRLGTDRIDLLQLHHIDREVPVEEVLTALDHLRTQGKVLYVGSSNFAAWNIAQYVERATAFGRPRLVTEQSVFNLAQRSVELEVLPALIDYGMGMLVWSPLAGGLLAGILSKTDLARSKSHWALPRLLEQTEAYEAFAHRRCVHPATIALAWLLQHPGVTAPVIGPRTVDHLHAALDATTTFLDAEDLHELDRIWPGPGSAPEAYAW